MPGSIDLNSVIAMMNQAAERSQSYRGIKQKPVPDTPLAEIEKTEKGKKAFEDAKKAPEPVKVGTPVASNMLTVDPVSQALVMQNMDASQQNYLMQAFNIVNGGMQS